MNRFIVEGSVLIFFSLFGLIENQISGRIFVCEELRKKMALGKRCGWTVKNANEGLGLGFVRLTRSVSGKRIAISSDLELGSSVNTPMQKKHCSEKMVQISSSEKSLLESLPQDILIRVLCGVDHDDLKQLVHVSKTLKDATLIARKWHFAYSTPKKVPAFRNPIHLGGVGDFEEPEAPNAPRQSRARRIRLSEKELTDVSVALFGSPDEEEPQVREDLFMEM